jgi:hypothetical protein
VARASWAPASARLRWRRSASPSDESQFFKTPDAPTTRCIARLDYTIRFSGNPTSTPKNRIVEPRYAWQPNSDLVPGDYWDITQDKIDEVLFG